ncbi:hypothetical protein S7335_4807 [Synechococcus sp. PCC 7335]|uniref:hypothetical protein n=1 Tax=Synechococcus sp. (strain ATCC 29403 / PCC 7335) TaxID=91464 RepID=UPI00017EC056|nr:hypothetical protein [Synechococcus sp. PCC 7335]EDX87100.1 hypothetical protein S7335_4807 [Synechococcus sp. PCC 7335]
MTIDRQLQKLIEDAPSEANLRKAIQVVSPIISNIASQLQHLEYYILQTANRQWLQATIAHKDNPTQSKRVIYAYPSLSSAAGDKLAASTPNLMAIPVPVAQLLFQLPSITPVDSLIFIETEARDQAIEVRRDDIKAMFHSRLSQHARRQVPPDIA